jgi:hypothetical protein
MKKLLLIALLAGACNPTGYYVANVFADESGMYTQRCAIDGGAHSDKPDPEHCRYERVAPPPPEVRAQFPAGTVPATPATPATPPMPAGSVTPASP